MLSQPLDVLGRSDITQPQGVVFGVGVDLVGVPIVIHAKLLYIRRRILLPNNQITHCRYPIDMMEIA